jgi:hypothetical protein
MTTELTWKLLALLAAPAIAGVAPASTELIIEEAKKNIAQIDKEARDKPAPETKPDGKYSKLSRAFERAYVGANPHDWRGYHEGPDGVMYYTETIHGETKCFMTGPVDNPSGKGRGGIQITCDKSTSWTRY